MLILVPVMDQFHHKLLVRQLPGLSDLFLHPCIYIYIYIYIYIRINIVASYVAMKIDSATV